jgi:hypothetical protein
MAKAQVILVWTFNNYKFRLVYKHGDQYVIDIQMTDSIGDMYWKEHTAVIFKKDLSTSNLLMSAVMHLLNPNALIANDAELEGRPADAAEINKQTDKPLSQEEVIFKIKDLFGQHPDDFSATTWAKIIKGDK